MLDFKLKRLPGGCEGASECIAAIPVCAAVLQLLQPGGRGRSPRFRAGGSILLRRGKRSCDVSSCERNDRSPIIFPYIYISTLPTLSKRRRLAILEHVGRRTWQMVDSRNFDRSGEKRLSLVFIDYSREGGREMVDGRVR